MGLMFAGLIAAQPMPAPVAGFVEYNGIPADGIGVVVTNLDTDEVLTSEEVISLRTERGKFMFDLGQFKEGYIVKSRRGSGDMIEIKVCDVAPECVLTYELVDTSVRQFRFSILSKDLPEPVIIEKVVETEKIVEKEVEVEVVVEKTVYVCENGDEAESSEDCPEIKWNTTQSLVVALISLVAVGLVALYRYDRSKYKWAMGMAGILKSHLKKAEEYRQAGDHAKALKKLNTARKTAVTLINKYIKNQKK